MRRATLLNLKPKLSGMHFDASDKLRRAWKGSCTRQGCNRTPVLRLKIDMISEHAPSAPASGTTAQQSSLETKGKIPWWRFQQEGGIPTWA